MAEYINVDGRMVKVESSPAVFTKTVTYKATTTGGTTASVRSFKGATQEKAREAAFEAVRREKAADK